MSGSSEAVVSAGGNAGRLLAGAALRAPALHRTRGVLAANIAIVLLFMSLLIDGFPAGAAVLREFGARAANFLLVIAWMVLVVRCLMKRETLGLRTYEAYALVAILAGAPLLNLPVALMQSEVGVRLALTDWIKQYLMLGWGLASYFIWKRIVADMDSRRYCALMCISAVLPILAFLLEYADSSGTTAAVLDLFRMKRDVRPSSLATEPSIYGAWIAFLWPLMFYYGLAGRRVLARLAVRGFLVVAIATALLSNARTFAVVLMLQLLYICYWSIQKQRGWGTRIRSLLLGLCLTTAAVLFLAGRLMSTTNLSDNESDITRIGDTVAGINVALAHPLVGVGIGEFGNFIAQYAPTFALRSIEVEKDIAGSSEYRASTFNMFVRLFVEFGIPLGSVFVYLILRPVIRAPKRAMGERFVLYAALSAVGGVGFWFSQDTYGYQPAILSLAVLSVSLAGMVRSKGNGSVAAGKV